MLLVNNYYLIRREVKLQSRFAVTTVSLIDPIASRWSPRAFDESHSLTAGALEAVFEAARWSASANNTQPWRFIITRRGGEAFAKIEQSLLGFNQQWAGRAAALVVNVAKLSDTNGKELPWAKYDLGQAVASYSLQARAEGLFVHQMGGFSADEIRSAFGLPEIYEPVSVTALGQLGDLDTLPETLREREQAERSRVPLDDLILLND